MRVLDVGLLVQAPQAAQLLGELGADVIKVELPGLGDQARWIPVSLEDHRAPFFEGCNRGKRSITVDLRVEAGRDVFLRLVETADVVLSNFVPGTMERWGLGYADLASRNPRIVVGMGSTFGPLGPDADRRGADIAGQAASGLLRTTGSGAGDEGPIGVTIADHIGSQNLCNGVLAALLARERTGRGQEVQVSLLGALIYAQASEYTWSLWTGEDPPPADRGHALIPLIYGVFPTADGMLAVVGVAADRRAAFFDALGRPELLEDERFASLILSPENRRALFDELTTTFRERSTEEWERILRRADQRVTRVKSHLEVARDPGVLANGYLRTVSDAEGGDHLVVGCPIHLSDTPARDAAVAPELGQHTAEILAELGYGVEEIASLRDGNVT
ncbi:MAG: CoA transferase [Myxococcota bacterium]|nr:CoA transferase [Myxococcota bacterium]